MKEIKILRFNKRPPFQNKCFIYILYMVWLNIYDDICRRHKKHSINAVGPLLAHTSPKSFVRLESKRILLNDWLYPYKIKFSLRYLSKVRTLKIAVRGYTAVGPLLAHKVRYWPDPDPKWFISEPDPDPAKSCGSDRIRIHNTDINQGFFFCPGYLDCYFKY